MMPTIRTPSHATKRMAVILAAGALLLTCAWYLTQPMEVVQANDRRHTLPTHAPSAAVSVKTSMGMETTFPPVAIDPGILRDPFAPINPAANLNRPSPVEAAKARAMTAAVARRAPKNEAVALPPPSPPQPVAAPVSPPAIPQAPALPFTYRGGQQSARITGGTATAFLSDTAGNNIVVRSGDTLNGTYRVLSIGEQAIEFLYLPLNIPQKLALPARTP